MIASVRNILTSQSQSCSGSYFSAPQTALAYLRGGVSIRGWHRCTENAASLCALRRALTVLPGKQSIDLHIEVLAPLQDVLPSCAFVFHPELPQDAAGCRIVGEMARIDAVQPEILKSESQHLACGFRAISVAPKRSTDPVSELGAIVLGMGVKTNAAAQSAIVSEKDAETCALPLLPD